MRQAVSQELVCGRDSRGVNAETARRRFYGPDQYNNDGIFPRMPEDVVSPDAYVLDAR